MASSLSSQTVFVEKEALPPRALPISHSLLHPSLYNTFSFLHVFLTCFFYKAIPTNMLRIQYYRRSFQFKLRGPNLKTVTPKYVIVADMRLVTTKQYTYSKQLSTVLIDCLLIICICCQRQTSTYSIYSYHRTLHATARLDEGQDSPTELQSREYNRRIAKVSTRFEDNV